MARFVYCIGEIEVGTNWNYSLKLFQLSELGGWNFVGCVSVSEMSDKLATTLPTTVNQDIVAVLLLLGVLLGVLLVVLLWLVTHPSHKYFSLLLTTIITVTDSDDHI